MPISISLASYPKYDPELDDPEAERMMAVLQGEIRRARNEKAHKKLDPKAEIQGVLRGSGWDFEVILNNMDKYRKLTGVNLDVGDLSTPGYAITYTMPAGQEEAQRKRLEKEIEQLEKVIANTQRQLGDEKFTSKAPAHIIDGMKVKLGEYELQLEKNREALRGL